MKSIIQNGVFSLVAVIGTMVGASSAVAAETLYVCDKGNPYIQVLVKPNAATVSLLIESEAIELSQKPSLDSSLRYESELGGDRWQVFTNGNQVSMRFNRDPKKTCVNESAAAAPTNGIVSQVGNFSLGGKVRAGPSTKHKKIDSLPFGEPVVLIARTGKMLDGYEWFKISYSEGLEGYQWGGIMCSNALHINGLFSPCPAEIE